jgi:hypothetical protein
MRKLLVIAPLMAVWAVLLLALSQTPSVSVPEAEAGPYLTFAHCRGALVGQYGSDNDVAYEMRRLNAVRWSFGGAARIDHLTIAQALWFRRQNGALTSVFYVCALRANGVADWRFTPYPA